MTERTASKQTLMLREAGEAPARVADLFDRNAAAFADLARRIVASPPRLIMTCARGSSDHAATYLHYLSQIHLGVPAMSLPPSIASVYRSGMDLKDVLFIVVSQSGRSPDLVAGADWAMRQGAYVVALANDDSSPVAAAAHAVLPLWAGLEQSVAATKSFLTSMAAAARLVGDALGDGDFSRAVATLPETLDEALDLDWGAAAPALVDGPNAYVVGRGPGLAAASEMALKLKETSAMHAEAFSTAEVMHGPLGLLREKMPVLVVGQNDETLAGVRELAFSIEARGAAVFRAFEGTTGPGGLPVVAGVHAALAPIAAVQSFYPLASMLSLARGLDPDRPAHLKKVTETR